MRVSDFYWLANDELLIAGSLGFHNELIDVRIIENIYEAYLTAPGQFVIVPQSIYLVDASYFEAVLTILFDHKAAGLGIKWDGDISAVSFPAHIFNMAQNNFFPIILIPPSVKNEDILRQVSAYNSQFYSSDEYLAFVDRLMEFTSRPYTVIDLVSFINNEINASVDCFCGKSMTPRTFYNSLGILDLNSFVKSNMNEIVATNGVKTYPYGDITVYAFNVKNPIDNPAILTVTLPHEKNLGLFEIQAINEILPYVSMSILTESSVSVPPRGPGDLFFDNIMTGAGENADTRLKLREEAFDAGLGRSDRYFVWILDYSPHKRTESADLIIRYTKAADSGCIYKTYPNKVLFISTCGTGDRSVNGFFDGLLCFLDEKQCDCDFKISVSTVLTELESLRAGFLQARFAMALGQRVDSNSPIYRYDRYILYHLLCGILDNPVLSRISKKTIDRLIAYDKENKAQLFPTLQELLSCDFNVCMTARRMNTHRNTINMRIDRINTILDMDLNFFYNKIILQIAVIEKMLLGLSLQEVNLRL